MKISHTDEDDIKSLLMGRKVTKVADDMLTLNDGRTLTIVPNDGCGGCSNGWYSIDELNGCDNMITNVTFDNVGKGDYDTFQVFVYAEHQQIKLLEVSGGDNGYYGRGYWITVST